MSMPKVKVAAIVAELADVNYRKLGADLERAVERELRCGTNVPDGFASRVDGGGGGSGTSDPTLATFLARERVHRDRLRACTEQAVADVVTAAAALQRCLKQLRNIDDLVADAPITPKGCDLCTAAGVLEGGQPVPWEHRGNVGGRLTSDLCLCGGHYDFVRRKGYAPSVEQTRRWHATGTWRVRD